MTKKLFSWLLIVVFIAGLVNAAQAAPAPKAAAEPVAIGALPVYGTHLVPPREDKIIQDLTLAGRITKDSTEEEVTLAITEYREKFAKDSISWVNPEVRARAEAREQEPASQIQSGPKAVSVQIFALNVEFEEDGTMFEGTDCDGIDVSFDGPKAGNIPAPGAGDNITLWYDPDLIVDDTTREVGPVYHDITFGYTGAGVVRTDMHGGAGVDLTGYTVQDYYDKVAGAPGLVTLNGDFYGWVEVPNDEAYYGAPFCDPDTGAELAHDIRAQQLVVDAVDAFNAANPGFEWSDYDKDGDQVIDTFWVLHAGAGQETGGGDQAGFSLWSHSSDLRYYANWYPIGYQVAGADTPADETDDYFVGPYTMNPEVADVGVLAEEFGHNVFGLPDLYVTDVENSVGFWAIMSAGAYGGELAGSIPVGMPLWFRMVAWCGTDWCGWEQPMVRRAYDAPLEDITIGTLEDTPDGTVKGVRVDMPRIEEEIPNYAGTGKGAWSGSGRDMTDVVLYQDITLAADAPGVLSFDSYWEIEEDWDYGYVAVSSDGGTTWDYLQDTTGYTTDTNPNGNNLGWGLTGFDEAALEYDLSAYAGTTIRLAFWYKLDAAANEAGWWIDNVMLDGVLVDDFETAVDPDGFPGWTNSDPDPWFVVPSFKTYTNYYLLEYRGFTKYDSQLQTAYVTTDLGDDYWTVARIPYNIPGGLLWYRNTKYPEGYSQLGYYADAPSYGPKNKILVVDMNWERMMVPGQPYSMNNRRAAYDAAITLQDTEEFTIDQLLLGGVVVPGPYVFDSKPAVEHFNDALGYTAGFEMDSNYDVYYSNRDGSAVIPAEGPYSTRFRDYDTHDYLYDFFGIPFMGSTLGTGNPGDDNVQYGVNIKAISDDRTGTDIVADRGTFRFYNYSVDMYTDHTMEYVAGEGYVHTFTVTVENTGTEATADGMLRNIKSVARPVFVEFVLSSGLEIKSVSVEDGVTTDFAAMIWEVPALKSGESKVLTVTAVSPFEEGYKETWIDIYMADGQMERFPTWLTFEQEGYQLFMPMVGAE